MHLLTLIF